MFDSPVGTDYGQLLDELRTHTSEWLHDAREEAVREQRRWRLRELAITRVLDERGQVDDTLAARDGIPVRAVRDAAATARALEDLPCVAGAAARGELSPEQLRYVTRLADPADPASDEHWAHEGPKWSPTDLADRVRCLRTPTVEDSRARRAARELRWWWRADGGMLDGRFSLPDIDGARFEAVIQHLVERMRPAEREPWEPRERRAADALVRLCDALDGQSGRDTRGGSGLDLGDHRIGETDRDARAIGPQIHMVVEVPLHGPATVAGIPLADEMLEQLRANARIEPVLVDEQGAPVRVGRAEPVLSPKIKRAVRLRDGHCRWPGCDQRVGLEIHHLWPRSWGGRDDFGNLAAVCPRHHRELAPHGDLLLLGNPNQPAGLTVVHRDDLPALAELAARHPEPRAGPGAA